MAKRRISVILNIVGILKAFAASFYLKIEIGSLAGQYQIIFYLKI